MSIPVSHSLADDDSAVLMEFIVESQGDMERIADQLTELCSPATDGDLTGAIYSALRSLTVNSAFMGLIQQSRSRHRIHHNYPWSILIFMLACRGQQVRLTLYEFGWRQFHQFPQMSDRCGG